MNSLASQISVDSQPIDRVSFVAYFLGAIIPLLALGYMAETYVFPQVANQLYTIGTIALIVCIGLLSLAAYALLRRSTRKVMQHMHADRARLAGLLEASELLAVAPHRSEAARVLTDAARKIVNADATFLRARGPKGELETIGQSGADALDSDCRDLVDELAERTLSDGPLTQVEGSFAAGAVPMVSSPDETGALIAVNKERVEPFGEDDLGSLATLAGLGAVAFLHSELRDVQRNFFVQLTDLVVVALDRHLDYHEGHARRVAAIANRIGRELGLPDDRLERLHFASLLHDIGVLKMDRAAQDDKASMKPHPVLGHRLLRSISLWEDLAPFVLYHHEHWDGHGYPEGLAGDAIPLEARIIGLAEALDSMTSAKSYKEPISSDEAVRRVREASGTQFDPEVVRVFLDLLERGVIEL